MKFDVITFGSAVVDVFVDTDISERRNFISYPIGSKILIKDLKADIGGGGTNTAVAFSRFGLRTGCVCKVGDDNEGEKILELLKEERVRFLGSVEKGGVSGYSVILDSKEKNRTILTYKGVNNELGFDEINLRWIKTKWLYCSSLMGKSFRTQEKLVKTLVARGVKFAFNPSDYLIKEKNLSSLLKLTGILILNKEEAGMLVGRGKGGEGGGDRGGDLLLRLHKLVAEGGIVVVTDKNKLISCYDGKKKYFLRPHKMKVVERTGAGDAFASGFVAGQIAGFEIGESLRLGLKESESVIKYFGAKNKLLRMRLK